MPSNEARHTKAGLPMVLTTAAMALILVLGPGANLLATAGGSTGLTSAPALNSCQHPTPPSWFNTYLARAVRISGDLPSAWAKSQFIVKIVCWQGSGYKDNFRPHDKTYHHWHGIFVMTGRELATVAGPAQTSHPNAFTVTTKCFVWGWRKCPHLLKDDRIIQQFITGLRWIWLNFGRPRAAWINIRQTGRFNSYPRPGTNDSATRDPFGLCPVQGTVSYWDDFGQPRYVDGYHPHAGNDIMAPMGRLIRAPFAGLAVAHTGGTRGGNWVTVVGAKGYVQNDHLSRFGKLGYVKKGSVIGYVGMTGDAVVTHDHFEWHPWVPPVPLHVAPSGFSMVTDAIDPYPFLNKVCTP